MNEFYFFLLLGTFFITNFARIWLNYKALRLLKVHSYQKYKQVKCLYPGFAKSSGLYIFLLKKGYLSIDDNEIVSLYSLSRVLLFFQISSFGILALSVITIAIINE